MIKIRLFQASDADQIARLYHDTIREVNICDYTRQQVKAWAPDELYFRNWVEVCSNRFTFVADDEGAIAGFGELEPDGHIDCFFCHKNYQRRGVGSLIYQAIETKACELLLSQLFLEASITAKPFFESQGFSVIKKQEVACRGETFITYIMEKTLECRTQPKNICQHWYFS